MEISFEANSDVLSKKGQKTIDELLSEISVSQIKCVQVFGYTDDEGNELSNFDLSKRRAENVKEYMINKGVNTLAAQVYYYGKFIQPGGQPAENRVVQLKIFYQEEGEKPVHVPEAQFKRLPFDLDGDEIADFEATYVLIGSKNFSKWKGQIGEIRKENKTLIFHFDRVEQSYLMKGDTLKDVPKKRWGRSADVLVKYGNGKWGPYREDLQGQTEFYCGFKLVENKVRSVGWLQFRVVPETGELLLTDKEIKQNEWIVVGEH